MSRVLAEQLLLARREPLSASVSLHVLLEIRHVLLVVARTGAASCPGAWDHGSLPCKSEVTALVSGYLHGHNSLRNRRVKSKLGELGSESCNSKLKLRFWHATVQ